MNTTQYYIHNSSDGEHIKEKVEKLFANAKFRKKYDIRHVWSEKLYGFTNLPSVVCFVSGQELNVNSMHEEIDPIYTRLFPKRHWIDQVTPRYFPDKPAAKSLHLAPIFHNYATGNAKRFDVFYNPTSTSRPLKLVGVNLEAYYSFEEFTLHNSACLSMAYALWWRNLLADDTPMGDQSIPGAATLQDFAARHMLNSKREAIKAIASTGYKEGRSPKAVAGVVRAKLLKAEHEVSKVIYTTEKGYYASYAIDRGSKADHLILVDGRYLVDPYTAFAFNGNHEVVFDLTYEDERDSAHTAFPQFAEAILGESISYLEEPVKI